MSDYVSFQKYIDEDLLAKHQLIIPSKIFAIDRPNEEAQPKSIYWICWVNLKIDLIKNIFFKTSETDLVKFQQSTQSSRMRFSKSYVDDGFLPDPYGLKVLSYNIYPK